MAATIDTSRYGDLCRLCAAKMTPVTGINIFENDGRQVRKKIECCLALQVHQSDALPKMICGNCLYKLDMLFEFREMSIQTEKLLQDLVKEFSNEKTLQDSALGMMSMDQNGLILVHHQHPTLEVDMSHLNQRDDLIVSHGIILAQTHPQTVNLALVNHSLGLTMNHELETRDLSNHSMQEAILMGNNSEFTDSNLDLIHQQQHILQEQFGIHQGYIESDINMSVPQTNQDVRCLQKEKHNGVKVIDQIDYSQHRNLIVDHQNIQNLNCDVSASRNIKSESLHESDINNDNRLLIDSRLDETPNKMYLLQNQSDNFEKLIEDHSQCYYCNICGSAFASKISLEKHFEEHFKKCAVCLEIFETDEQLTKHLKEFHSPQGETAPIVEPIKTRLKRAVKSPDRIPADLNAEPNQPTDKVKEEVKKKNVTEKVKTEKQWSPKVCTECGKSYKTNYKLNEHMRKHTGETPYKCGSCEKSFRSKIGLTQHEAKHTGQYEFSCPTCGKGFQCRSYLRVHQRVHSDIKPWPCTTCSMSFKTKQALLDHTNRHLGLKQYICEICGRGFITKGLCKTHQRIHTGLDNRKFSCKICTKRFVSKSYLKTHLKIHTGEKPFICEVCGKGFLTRVDLKIHSTLHTGEKSYVCEICGKAFARRDALRCHRRSHTGERPYRCEICGQTFTQFTPMAIHKRLHTGERPYSCEVCKKSFVSKSTMMSHAKKHNNNAS